MTNKKEKNEYQRYQFIYEMEHRYLTRSYSDQEMGSELRTDRSNVNRIRKLMTESMGIPIEPVSGKRGQYFIDKTTYSVQHIPFSREQMVALYLAGRRLQQQTRTKQDHVARMLEKVSRALHKPLAEEMVKLAEQNLEQEQDPQQEEVFQMLTKCWLEGIPAKIIHRVLHGQARTYRVHPYLLEPSIWSDGTYLIGHSEYHGGIATFKLARIEKVVLGTGSFEIPDDFDIHTLLNHAWGIWHADNEPITVKLNFSKWVTPRVKETIWHPQQRITSHDDGSCTWETQVAEWKEMVPWVRGWGSDAEVTEPDDLRESIVAEVGRLVDMYDLQSQHPPHRLLWAKTDDAERTHPLFCHLIDVGNVALALWEDVLTEGFRRQIADALDIDPDRAGRLLAFWAALHDLGKACPNFQRKCKFPRVIRTLKKADFTFPEVFGNSPCYHATVSALIVPELLEVETDLDGEIAWSIGQALGGHHGEWPTSGVRQKHKTQLGDERWREAQKSLLQEMAELFNPPQINQLGRTPEEQGTILVLLSGLVSVADWIGSMNEYFHFSTIHVAPEVYMQISERRAGRALKKLGWVGWTPPSDPLSFDELHGFTPRAAQETVVQLAPGDDEPTLVIAELPTGAGKTELALYLADRWAALRQQRGLYVAMPTQATSNQMWERVGKFLRKRYPEQQINYHLIHSGARWRDDQPDFEFETEDEQPLGTIEAQGWFLPRKRTLLAPFAVGTVDQALMSTLQTKHFFVRLFGLSRKTIIFDEVHAYDIYMNTLFQRLLVWLHAVGASVIVLSATLPAVTRRALVTAWVGDGLLSDENAETLQLDALTNDYPAMTVASQSTLSMTPLPEGAKRSINIRWIGNESQIIVDELCQRIQDGGCIAIICNRVKRAQELYQALASAQLVPEEDLMLFHARTPTIWRNATEEDVLSRFGKEATERRPAIVIATQVIEQSLDLDFDLMITDLAPVDLVLQRAGRLHRHNRKERPKGMEEPTLLIAVPNEEDGSVPDFGGDAMVYEPYVLLRSLLTLRSNGEAIKIPEQTVKLIESVYGDEPAEYKGYPSELTHALSRARSKMDETNAKAEVEANRRLVTKPDHEDLLLLDNDLLAEESPEFHQTLQALTRLIQPSVSLVCLHACNDGISLDLDGKPSIDLDKEPTHEQTKALAQRVVTVTHPVIRRYFIQNEVPKGWREHSLLKNYRVVIFQDGRCELEGESYFLRLSQTLGLEIEKMNSDS